MRRLSSAVVLLVLLIAVPTDAAICCLRCVTSAGGNYTYCKDPDTYANATGPVICPCETTYNCMPTASGVVCSSGCDGEPCLWA
ncbi:MAG TPA: hypothetical protein VF846_04175 [Thermoanaerobaculia bacterium]|jgi:hypothetical protein